jgi:hypothetical protein
MEFSLDKIVFLKSDRDASSRTKGRIHSHGSEGFRMLRFDPASWHFGGTPAILFQSVTSTAKGSEPWFGWLPILELTEAGA